MIRHTVAALAATLLLAVAASSASAMSTHALAHKRQAAHHLMGRAHADHRYADFRRWRSRFRYWRNEHVWAERYDALPGWLKGSLARLRGCETRGVPFPRNYQYKGHHRGAYQYTFSTWRRAGGWGDPADATPHEQDVRTGRFWPSHRGEWACKA